MQSSRHENNNFIGVNHFLEPFCKICGYNINQQIIVFLVKCEISVVKKILEHFHGALNIKQITFILYAVKKFLRFQKNPEQHVNRSFFQGNYLVINQGILYFFMASYLRYQAVYLF